MTDKTKSQKVDEALDKADEIADVVKGFTPDVIDKEIEAKKELVKTGWGIFKMIKSLIPKKKK